MLQTWNRDMDLVRQCGVIENANVVFAVWQEAIGVLPKAEPDNTKEPICG